MANSRFFPQNSIYFCFSYGYFKVRKFQKFFPRNVGNFPFFLFPAKIGKVFPVLSGNWKYFLEIFLSEIFPYYLAVNTWTGGLNLNRVRG